MTGDYLPEKFGARLPRNACTPSAKSAVSPSSALGTGLDLELLVQGTRLLDIEDGFDALETPEWGRRRGGAQDSAACRHSSHPRYSAQMSPQFAGLVRGQGSPSRASPLARAVPTSRGK